jgi:hypothetical protein
MKYNDMTPEQRKAEVERLRKKVELLMKTADELEKSRPSYLIDEYLLTLTTVKPQSRRSYRGVITRYLEWLEKETRPDTSGTRAAYLRHMTGVGEEPAKAAEAAARDSVLSTGCPVCPAQPGERCIQYSTGLPSNIVHAARTGVWKENRET